MKLFAKVAIVGLGLIGGSIALGIKQKKLAGKINAEDASVPAYAYAEAYA